MCTLVLLKASFSSSAPRSCSLIITRVEIDLVLGVYNSDQVILFVVAVYVVFII
jgi:hypothetical protein